MSSNIASRRPTRPARPATTKDNENANTRLRTTTRSAKPLSSTSGPSMSNANGTIVPLASRVTAPTAASRAKASLASNADQHAIDPSAGKRKREALGEVTHLASHNISKSTKGASGIKDGKVKTESGVTRQAPPSRSTIVSKTSTKIRTTTVVRNGVQIAVDEVVKEEEENVEIDDAQTRQREPSSDHAMVVDGPSTKTQLPSVSTRLPLSRRTGQTLKHQRVTSRSTLKVEEAEDEPALKKRRTSSVPPEEANVDEEKDSEARIAAELQAYAEAPLEADPDGDEWDDLDAEDADDPVMVSEYVVEIFNYLKGVEQTTMANPTYMESQKELAWKMRGILTDWLVQVHVRFRLLPETLFLAVNIIDRFLSARVVSLAKLQLVGITCMFIAAKFEEIVAPSVMHFLQCADSSYNETEILQAEKYVLKTLGWNMSYPNPVHFLRRISKADDYDIKVRTLAKYLLEIACLEWRLIAFPPSQLAGASVWLARLALGKFEWTANLAHYSSYKESSLMPVVNIMINYLLKPIRHDSFFKKYAGKRFLKSSSYMREWVTDRWQENDQVQLEKELPRLRAECLAARMRDPSEELAL